MEINRERLLRAAKSGHSGRGRLELIGYLVGTIVPNRTQAIRAKCYECAGYYVDGAKDCGDSDCPLYPYHPYNAARLKRITRESSPEVKAARAERMRKMLADRRAK